MTRSGVALAAGPAFRMTKEEAEAHFMRRKKKELHDRLWLNDPRSWEWSNRRLSPAELDYAEEAAKQTLRDSA